jgi:hypothetical protein
MEAKGSLSFKNTPSSVAIESCPHPNILFT